MLHTQVDESTTYPDVMFEAGDDAPSYDVVISPFHDHHQRVVGRIVPFHDVSERRNAEKRLQQTSQLAALGELSVGVCHELNNPLSAIMGYAQLLNMQDLPHPISQDVDKIVSQAKRAAKIVDDLLSFSHRQQVRRSPVNISELVSQALSLREYALRRSGQEVDVAHSGLERWQAIQANTYDIFLLDLRMPEMNGKELFGRLEEWRPNLAKRVIFLTGDSLNDETQSFLADAGNSCLSKLFTLERNIQTQLVLQS